MPHSTTALSPLRPTRLLLIFTIFLSGCAFTPYSLNSLSLGMSKVQVVSAIGQPQSVPAALQTAEGNWVETWQYDAYDLLGFKVDSYCLDFVDSQLRQWRQNNIYFTCYAPVASTSFAIPSPPSASYQPTTTPALLPGIAGGRSTPKSGYDPSLAVLDNASSDDKTSVRGYFRKDGTYVRPHTRSRPRR